MRQTLTIAILLCSWRWAFGQDVHFSQFDRVPLTLNPALTGYFDGNIRAAANHRQQWSSVTIPYITSSFAVDTRAWEDRLKGDAIGMGMLILHDKAGDGNLTHLRMMASVSYHKKLSREGKHWLSVGAQAGFMQKSLDQTKLTFASQFQDIDFNPALASNESFADFTVLKPDFQAGVNYQWNRPKSFSFRGGIGLFHLSQPNQSFLDQVDQLSMRQVLHASMEIQRGSEPFLKPALVIMRQNGARELNLGANYYYTMKSDADEKVRLNAGAWLRATGSDALILSTGAAYKQWLLGFSYDVNISSLHVASGYRGGFEISLVFVDRLLLGKDKLPEILPCERL